MQAKNKKRILNFLIKIHTLAHKTKKKKNLDAQQIRNKRGRKGKK